MGTLDPLIEVVDLCKAYGQGSAASVALRGISFSVGRGAFVSLVGPSGSGKTTLLNMLAGLDTPDRGRVLVDGHDLGRLGDAALSDLRLRSIGFIFQAFNLIPSLTVSENVAWPLEFVGVRRKEVRRRVEHVLERVGVSNYSARYPSELSGGEQQRVAMARALASQPRLILADEPTGNLDSHTGRQVLDLLRDLNRHNEVTVVMVTHDVFAASYGDRTLELRDGVLVRDVEAPAATSIDREW